MTTAIAYPPVAGLPKPHHVRIVSIPERRCLAIDGESGGSEFQGAMSALYRTAYALHFLLRARHRCANRAVRSALGTPRWS